MNILFQLRQFLVLSVLVGTLVMVNSCDSDEPEEKGPDALLGDAKLNDFPLFEVDYLDIAITHPEITNGTETKPGKIVITIPFSQTSLMLSLKQFNLDNNKYNITPLVGEPRDYSGGPVRYTISAVSSPESAVHYDVTIKHGGDPFFVNAKITGFKFQRTKNPTLQATIEAFKIVEYENYSENAIYVIVPQGTDFSQLTPTITYDGAKLYYHIDNQFVEYTDNNMVVDFKYPKHFYLQAENSLGERSLSYNVIVDVADPIRFDSPIGTPDVITSDGTAYESFFAFASWTNQGNHPITGMSPVEYKNKLYPIPNYPGNTDIIKASMLNPTGGSVGVLPGEQGHINIIVNRSPVIGEYSTTAVFAPTFSFDTRVISYWPEDDRIEDIFMRKSLVIETTIID